eukprot:TRINITY_DN2575_c0_g1_i1.p1 TRINITY_DN2575_c0_g1~~TRINITY_DN2575_c0_g1_i1.p1  ORF type:complete len:161 (+),score=16.20 TRINITY_DN2575_c0_g1_i1:18-500(+)
MSFVSNRFEIVCCERVRFDADMAQRFYDDCKDKPFFPRLMEYMTRQLNQMPLDVKADLIFLFVPKSRDHRDGLAKRERNSTMARSHERTIARRQNPVSFLLVKCLNISSSCSLRQEFALNETEDAVHGSDSLESVNKEIGLLFPSLKNSPEPGIENNSKL